MEAIGKNPTKKHKPLKKILNTLKKLNESASKGKESKAGRKKDVKYEASEDLKSKVYFCNCSYISDY